MYPAEFYGSSSVLWILLILWTLLPCQDFLILLNSGFRLVLWNLSILLFMNTEVSRPLEVTEHPKRCVAFIL
jgi:hypothetical protein